MYEVVEEVLSQGACESITMSTVAHPYPYNANRFSKHLLDGIVNLL